MQNNFWNKYTMHGWLREHDSMSSKLSTQKMDKSIYQDFFLSKYHLDHEKGIRNATAGERFEH